MSSRRLGVTRPQVDRFRRVGGRARGLRPRKILKIHRVFLRFSSGRARERTPPTQRNSIHLRFRDPLLPPRWRFAAALNVLGPWLIMAAIGVVAVSAPARPACAQAGAVPQAGAKTALAKAPNAAPS